MRKCTSFWPAALIGTVVDVQGVATDGSKRLVAGDPIYQDDVIETQPGATVKLLFNDNSNLNMSGKAKVTLDYYVYDPTNHQGSLSYSWVGGAFEYLGGLIQHTKPNQIETEFGNIGIRGTQFIARTLFASDGVTVTGAEVDLIAGKAQ